MATANGDASQGASPSVQEAKTDAEATADDLARAPETLNMSDSEEMNAANSKDNSEGGKIKALLNVLRRMIGVKDLAAIRLSLPANLLEPVPNLEYWNYMDRADLFTAVGDVEDPVDRMLSAIRFMLSKELKFVHGKVCKPYNSILGEHFRCHWTVQPLELNNSSQMVPKMALRVENPSPLPLAGATTPSRPKQAKAERRAGASSSKELSVDESQDKSGTAASSAAGSTISQRGGGSGGGNAGKNATISGAGTAPLSPMQSSESGKTRRGISRLLSAARNPKSSANSTVSSDSTSTANKSPSLSAQAPEQDVDESVEGGDATGPTDEDEPASPGGSFKTSKSEADGAGRRVCFITEQVSHHPPISSFFVECKDAGVQLRGVDQLSAKFTGTNIKIYPGEFNQGIFLSLTDKARSGADGEEYKITHPTASINGLLRGSLWVSIQNTTHIVCRGGRRSNDNGKRLCALTEYKDESWVMKAKYALEGAVYEYDEGSSEDPEQYKTVRDIPQDRIVFTFEGTWKGQVTWKFKGEKEARLLIDLNELDPIKTINVRPLESQEEMESRRIWSQVTEAIQGKEFGMATKHKQAIEQAQREAAAERKRKGENFTPRFFEENIDDGRPKLTEAGRAALDGELSLDGYK